MSDSVLVDTPALYAVLSPSDAFHSRAKSLYETLINGKAELYLTSYVLLETTTIVHRRLGFATLRKLMDAITPIIQVYWVDESVYEQAQDIMLSRNGVGPSLVDWTTILVAKRLSALVFTFDRQLEAEGLIILPRKA